MERWPSSSDRNTGSITGTKVGQIDQLQSYQMAGTGRVETKDSMASVSTSTFHSGSELTSESDMMDEDFLRRSSNQSDTDVFLPTTQPLTSLSEQRKILEQKRRETPSAASSAFANSAPISHAWRRVAEYVNALPSIPEPGGHDEMNGGRFGLSQRTQAKRQRIWSEGSGERRRKMEEPSGHGHPRRLTSSTSSNLSQLSSQWSAGSSQQDFDSLDDLSATLLAPFTPPATPPQNLDEEGCETPSRVTVARPKDLYKQTRFHLESSESDAAAANGQNSTQESSADEPGSSRLPPRKRPLKRQMTNSEIIAMASQHRQQHSVQQKRQNLFSMGNSNVSDNSDTDISAPSVNSIDDLLTARRDPEEILLNLGFGGGTEQEDIMDRIPSRFLQQPSKAQGISVYAFLNQIDELERGCGFSLIGGLRSLGPALRRSSQMGRSPLSSRSVTPSPQPTKFKDELESTEITVKSDEAIKSVEPPETKTGVKDLEGLGKRTVMEKNNNKTPASRTVVFPEAVVTNHSSKSPEDRVTGQVKGQCRQEQTELNRRWDASTSSEFESSLLTGSDCELSFDSGPRTSSRPLILPLGQPLLTGDDNRDQAPRAECAPVKPPCLLSNQEQRSSPPPTMKDAPSETTPGTEKSRRRKISVERQPRICDLEDASMDEPRHDNANLTSSRSSKNELELDEVGHERLQDGGSKEKGSSGRPRPLHVDVLCSGGIRLLDTKEDSFEFEELSSEERLEDANAALHSASRNHHRGRRGSTQSDSSGFSDEGIGSSELASPHQAPHPADNCSKITSQSAQVTQTSFDINQEEIELFESRPHNDDISGHAISDSDTGKDDHPTKVFVTDPELHQLLPPVSSLEDSPFDDTMNIPAEVIQTNKSHKSKRAHTCPNLASLEETNLYSKDSSEIHEPSNAMSSELDTVKSNNTPKIDDRFKNTTPSERRRAPKLRKMRSVDPDFYSYKRYEDTPSDYNSPGAEDSASHVCAASATVSQGILAMADLRSKSFEHGMERIIESAEQADDAFPSSEQLRPNFIAQSEQLDDENNVQNVREREKDQAVFSTNSTQDANDTIVKEHQNVLDVNVVQGIGCITPEQPHIGIECSSPSAGQAVIPSSAHPENWSSDLVSSSTTADIHSTSDKGSNMRLIGGDKETHHENVDSFSNDTRSSQSDARNLLMSSDSPDMYSDSDKDCQSEIMHIDQEKTHDNVDNLQDDARDRQPEVVDCHLVCEEYSMPFNVESESLSPAIEHCSEETSQRSERTASDVQPSDRKSLQEDSALCSQPEVVDGHLVCEEVIKPLNIETAMSLSPAAEHPSEESLQRSERITADVQASDRKSLQESSALDSLPEVMDVHLVCEEVVKPLNIKGESLSPLSEESSQKSERTTQVQASDRKSLEEDSGTNEEKESQAEATTANVHHLERSETRIEAISREEHIKAREELKVLLASQDDSVHLFPALPTNNQEEAIEDLKLLQRALCRYHRDLDLLESWSHRMYENLGLGFTREERENLGGLSKVRYQIKGEIFSLEKSLMEKYQSAVTSAAGPSEAEENIWSVSLSQVMCEMVHLLREQTSLQSFLDDLDAREEMAAESTLGPPLSPRLMSPPSSSSPQPRKEDKRNYSFTRKNDEKKSRDPKCISESVDPGKERSVDPNRDKSKLVDPNRGKSQSLDLNMDKLRSVDRRWGKSKSVDTNMDKLKSVDPTRGKSECVDPNRDKSDSSNRDSPPDVIDPNRDTSEFVDPLEEVTDLVDLRFPQMISQDELEESSNRDTPPDVIDLDRDTSEFVDPLEEVTDLVDLTFPQMMSQEDLVEELEQAQQDLARMRVKARQDVVQAVKQVRESVMSDVRREFHLETQLLQVQMKAKDLEIEQLRTIVSRLKGTSATESSLDKPMSDEPQKEGKIT